jgi:hypothetical protein
MKALQVILVGFALLLGEQALIILGLALGFSLSFALRFLDERGQGLLGLCELLFVLVA